MAPFGFYSSKTRRAFMSPIKGYDNGSTEREE